jgi:DNA-binding beta-propeller fold protein YncE
MDKPVCVHLVLSAVLAACVAAPMAFAQAGASLLMPQKPITIPGGASRFGYMAIDSEMNRVMASHPGASTLVIYDLKTKSVKEVNTGVKVNGIAIDAVDDKLFAAGAGGKVIVFNRATLAKTDEIALAGPGEGLALDPRTDKLYACHDEGAEDWVIDAATDKVVGSAAVDGDPEGILYDAASNRIYQNIRTANEVQSIDPSTNTVTATWPTSPMTSPHGIAIDTRTRRLFAAGGATVVMIDMNTGKVVSSVDIAPGRVDQIAFDNGLHRLYCASRGGQISVIQETAPGAKLAGIVNVPAGTHSLAVDQNDHSVWICYSDDKNSYLQQYRAAPVN